MTTSYEIRPIGHIESSLVDREAAPKQGFEGAPDAWLVFELGVSEGLRDLAVGDEVFVLTWLHRARRDVLAVHPRDDPETRDRSVQHPLPGQARIRSDCTESASPRSTCPACLCGISKLSMERTSWTEASAHRRVVNDRVLRVTLARWWRRSEVGDLLLHALVLTLDRTDDPIWVVLAPRQESNLRLAVRKPLGRFFPNPRVPRSWP
jgi:hypothetical protein